MKMLMMKTLTIIKTNSNKFIIAMLIVDLHVTVKTIADIFITPLDY